MDINYGLLSSFWNISDKNREEYDLKKHQGQRIWQGNRLCLTVGKNKPRNTRVFETTAKQAEQVDETRTARTRVWASCAHASLCNFTSGSRRSLSRPRILRSLLYPHVITFENLRVRPSTRRRQSGVFIKISTQGIVFEHLCLLCLKPPFTSTSFPGLTLGTRLSLRVLGKLKRRKKKKVFKNIRIRVEGASVTPRLK